MVSSLVLWSRARYAGTRVRSSIPKGEQKALHWDDLQLYRGEVRPKNRPQHRWEPPNSFPAEKLNLFINQASEETCASVWALHSYDIVEFRREGMRIPGEGSLWLCWHCPPSSILCNFSVLHSRYNVPPFSAFIFFCILNILSISPPDSPRPAKLVALYAKWAIVSFHSLKLWWFVMVVA